MSTHTPGPWKVVKYNNGMNMDIQNEAGEGVLTKQNAAFIVRACNSHEAMLEALKQTRLNALAPVATDWGVVVERLDEAIRLAEGRS